MLSLALTLSYAVYGVNVGWCDSCGSLRIYGEERWIGEICPDCVEYWLGDEKQLRKHIKDSDAIVYTT